MRTTRLSRLAALLMLGGALMACDRDPPEPADRTSSRSPAPSEGVRELPPSAGTTPIPPPSADPLPGAPAPDPSSAAYDGAVTEADRAFVIVAIGSGLAEIEAGRLAAREGSNPEVKDFAARLLQDHVAINERLAQIAEAKEVVVAAALPETARAVLAEMRKASGEQLDSLYLRHFGSSTHRASIALYERQAREGHDPDLRAFAEETLALLHKHEEFARALQQALASRMA